MSEHEFENYLALLSRLLRLSPQQRESVAEELRDHMEARLSALRQQGVPHNEAVRQALEEFGDANSLATEFSSIAAEKKKRWMMRATAGSMLTALAAAFFIGIYWPDDWKPAVVPSAVAQQNTNGPASIDSTGLWIEDATQAKQRVRIEAALDKVGPCDFVETPLAEVTDFLGELLDIPIDIDDSALEDIGVSHEEPVSFQSTSLRARDALYHLLKPLSLTTTIRDGALLITTPENEEFELLSRGYPVWDLVRPTGDQKAADYDSLIELITVTIAPTTWEEVGGVGGLNGYKGLLLATNTRRVQREIIALLADLRKVPPVAAATGSTIPAGTADRSEVNDPIQKALEKDAAFDFVETPLAEVADYLSSFAAIPVLLDKTALEDIGITKEEPFSGSISETPLRLALNR